MAAVDASGYVPPPLPSSNQTPTIQVKVVGGDAFKKAMADMAKKVERETVLRVGFLEGATYPDGTSVAMVAAIQNYGAPRVGIPPRPFMQNTVARNEKDWPKQMAAMLRANQMDVKLTMNMMGELIRSQIQEEIIRLVSPPLSPTTVMLRKMKRDQPGLVVTRRTVAEARRRVEAGESISGVSAKPLIDTGVMLRSVDYEVIT